MYNFESEKKESTVTRGTTHEVSRVILLEFTVATMVHNSEFQMILNRRIAWKWVAKWIFSREREWLCVENHSRSRHCLRVIQVPIQNWNSIPLRLIARYALGKRNTFSLYEITISCNLFFGDFSDAACTVAGCWEAVPAWMPLYTPEEIIKITTTGPPWAILAGPSTISSRFSSEPRTSSWKMCLLVIIQMITFSLKVN